MDWNETPAELGRAWAEQPVIMPGQHGNLYGVFTPPAPEASPAGVCVIFFGRNRWWGDRISVKGARWLAARGFACLRFDYHGYGESEGVCQSIHGDRPYAEDAVSVIGFMRKAFAQQRFSLVGFCFDGRTALAALEQEGAAIETIASITPMATELPGELFSYLNADRIRTFFYLPVFHKKRVIHQALRRGLHFAKIIARRRGSGETPHEINVSERFRRELQALVHWRVPCLFLYGRDDSLYHGFQLIERSFLAKLDPAQRALITVEVRSGKAHVPEDPESQRNLAERALRWIDDFRQKPFALTQSPQIATVPAATNGFRPSKEAARTLSPASGFRWYTSFKRRLINDD
jgi:alpha/beta superfamily hydrolase